MLSGLNTDIQYKGEVFHVQTEDGGANNPVITTLLFKGGAIFSSKKTNYGEILKSASYQDIVKELMKEQHKNMVRDLASGKFERPQAESVQNKKIDQNRDVKGADQVDQREKAVYVKEETASVKGPPSKADPAKLDQEKPAKKKSLDDLILDYLSKKEETLD
jgi:hypothetical protein